MASRVGRLGPRALGLAAYCGSPAASAVQPPTESLPEDLEEWVRGLRRWGRECLVRAVTALAEAVLPWGSPAHTAGNRAIVEAMQAYLARPSPQAREEVYRAADDACLPKARPSLVDDVFQFAADVVWVDPEEEEDGEEAVMGAACLAASYATEVMSAELLRHVVSRALLLWVRECGEDWVPA